MSGYRVYFPQTTTAVPTTTLLLDVQLLLRPPAHAPTLAEANAALCDTHGEAT